MPRVAAQGQDIVPLTVAKTRTGLREVLGALDVTLSAQDLGDRGGGAACRGARRPLSGVGMASLDSERG
jgi:hypothetical protein